jgi:hypothetical protein
MSPMDELDIAEPEVVLRLVRMVNGLSGRDLKRWRLAVTFDEWMAMREYFLVRDGKWWNRIRDIPLVIEDDPENPVLAYEPADDQDYEPARDAPTGDPHG